MKQINATHRSHTGIETPVVIKKREGQYFHMDTRLEIKAVFGDKVHLSVLRQNGNDRPQERFIINQEDQ